MILAIRDMHRLRGREDADAPPCACAFVRPAPPRVSSSQNKLNRQQKDKVRQFVAVADVRYAAGRRWRADGDGGPAAASPARRVRHPRVTDAFGPRTNASERAAIDMMRAANWNVEVRRAPPPQQPVRERRGVADGDQPSP